MNAVVSTITRKSIFKTSTKDEQYHSRHGIVLFFFKKRIYTLIAKNYMYVYNYTSTRQMSEPGISNCAFNNSFSRIDLRPLAPVFFLIASLEIIFKASGVKCNSTGFPLH